MQIPARRRFTAGKEGRLPGRPRVDRILQDGCMALTIRRIPRADLPENGVITFQAEGVHYLVADLDGELAAFAVTGPAVRDLDRAVIAEGRLRCPAHGWAIDPLGECGAASLCRYDPIPVELHGDEIQVPLLPP
jgi:nitrite reductase/ring-hydroxylating ferredoxin subunit